MDALVREGFPRQGSAEAAQQEYLGSISAHRREGWDKLFGDASEGFEYYLACEHAAPPSFTLGALSLSVEGVLVAGAPAFEGEFELDRMLEGRARQVARKLAERVCGLADT